MEDELWRSLYQRVIQESKGRFRRRGLRISDACILLVFLWAVLHDRPVSWACCPRHWPPQQRWRSLPSPATMSRRLRSVSVQNLLECLLRGLGETAPLGLVRIVDAKPLPVSAASKDRDARRGYAAGYKAKGYKLHCIWRVGACVPEQWRLSSMNGPEPAAAALMIPALSGGGYLLGDAIYDTNPLYRLCENCNLQLIARRKKPGTQLGHLPHATSRLRSIELLETRPALPLARDISGAEACLGFGPSLYAVRAAIERYFGQWGNFGCGLSPLPNWVRRPHRVVLWTAAKLLINGVRICQKQGVAA
jgi:hypothetical protein